MKLVRTTNGDASVIAEVAAAITTIGVLLCVAIGAVASKLVKGVKMEDAEAAVWEELNRLTAQPVEATELEKVKNKVESTLEFSEMDLSGRALNLAIAEYMGDPELINTELGLYQAVSAAQVQQQAQQVFNKKNVSVLRYFSERN